MSKPLVEQVADAVLYEGYLLYPYRPSSVKNRQRWSFGGVYPRAYSEAQTGADGWEMRTECLLAAAGRARLTVRVRFLHLLERRVGELTPPAGSPPSADPAYRLVPELTIGERTYRAWQEATEREVRVETSIDELAGPVLVPIAFPAARQTEPLTGPDGQAVGVLLREHAPLAGAIEVSASRVDELFRVTVVVRNLTAIDESAARDRELALRHTFVATHAILHAEGAAFVSLLDPPPAWAGHAAACRNLGTYPVLAGGPGQIDTLLSSPIILYDYPQIAPESPGDLFDATEIDEILTLRILTMTDAEKQEMCATDERARALLERTEALAREQLQGLHGAVRSLRPLTPPAPEVGGEWDSWKTERPVPDYTRADGARFQPGTRVRLRPSRRADVFDLALAGQAAVIETIEQDFEGQFFFTVSVEDDPGRDLGATGQPGHRFFFHPDEVELLPPGREGQP